VSVCNTGIAEYLLQQETASTVLVQWHRPDSIEQGQVPTEDWHRFLLLLLEPMAAGWTRRSTTTFLTVRKWKKQTMCFWGYDSH
jgi:hypothetical protein